MGSEKRERGTNEVAALLDIAPDLLRKWKARGLLTKAPQGVSGQGRGLECHWPDEAVEEARQVMATRKRGPARTRRSALSTTTKGVGHE